MKQKYEIETLRRARGRVRGDLIGQVEAMSSHGEYCLYFYGKPDIQRERHRISVNIKYHASIPSGFKLKFRTVLADGNPAVAIYLINKQIEDDEKTQRRNK